MVLGKTQAGSEWIPRQLRLVVTLKNPKAHEVREQTLWLYVPAINTPTQKLQAIQVSMPYDLQSDSLGQGIVKLHIRQAAPFATKIVSIVADLLLATTPKPVTLDNPQQWLAAEKYIEVGDSRIQALARELRRPSECDTAYAIYDWLARNIQYSGYVADDRGARDGLMQRRGDCTEYAYLAVALARANGIPARMAAGFVTDRNTVLRAVDYHNWAEVYFDGAWRLLDAQKQRWLKPMEDYVAFRYYRDKAINPIGLANRYRMEGDLEVRI